MRKNRKSSIRKERIVMIASSAFVLAALTMTGVYMKEKSVESKDDGYSVDFAAIEKNVEDKYQEIAQNDADSGQDKSAAQQEIGLSAQSEQNLENDLDYMPLEVGSGLVEISGLTEGLYSMDESAVTDEEAGLTAEDTKEQEEDADEEVSADSVVTVQSLSFSEEDSLIRPTSGEILMPFCMESSVYFATLDQYKYNPAVIFQAEEGSVVGACANGRVVEIYEDERIGQAVTLDLGDGYQVTYGQLKELQVSEGGYVNAGDTIGQVAAPTKYYSVEGDNLYFKMTQNGEAINPEVFF